MPMYTNANRKKLITVMNIEHYRDGNPHLVRFHNTDLTAVPFEWKRICLTFDPDPILSREAVQNGI